MRNFERALVIGVAIALSGFATGCKQKLNTKKAEKLMKEKLPEMLQGLVEVKSVKCPKSVEAKKDETFTCTATLGDDTELRIDVVQKDDEGNVEWKPEPHLNAAAVQKGIVEEATKNGVADATADCGPAIKKTDLPATLECTLTAAGSTSKIEFSYDKDGNVTSKEVPQ